MNLYYMNGPKGRNKIKGLWTWWLYHARNFAICKVGQYDPWGAYDLPIAKGEGFMLKIGGAWWALWTLLLVVGIFVLIGILMTTGTGQIILLTVFAILAIVLVLYLIGRFLLRFGIKVGDTTDRVEQLLQSSKEAK